MKRFLKYFSVMLAFILVLTGCNAPKVTKKSAKEKLTDSVEKSEKVTNFSEKVTVSLNFDQDGKTNSVSSTVEGKVYTEGDNTLMYADVKASAAGQSMGGTLYADITKESAKLYVNYMGTWLKADTSILGDTYKEVISKVEANKISSKEIMEYAKEVKEDKTDDQGYTSYLVTLDKEKLNKKFYETLQKSMEETKKLEGFDEEDKAEMDKKLEEYKNGIFSNDLTITVYVKDGYFAGCFIDIKQIVDNVLPNVKDAETVNQIKSMNLSGAITVVMSDFNKVEKIVIPAEAQNGTDIMTLLGSTTSENVAVQNNQ